MLFFSRKTRRTKKVVSKKAATSPVPDALKISTESSGYDPYDTLPGLPRDEFGMRRQDDGKWSF